MTEPNPAGEPVNTSPPAQARPIVPDHKLLRLIGEGSGGQVWLARNVLGTYRAVKILMADPEGDQRPLSREFKGIARFEPISRLHDGLVDILQVGYNEGENYLYYVMELADDVKTGQTITPELYIPRTLAYDMVRQPRLPIGECVRLGAAVASALGFLHRHGLIHRDIKPSNIIFVNGFPKLADIGLVTRISEDKAFVGTEGFIPPEGPGTARADIYSLGKVLYEISTGLDRMQYPELPAGLKDNAEDCDMVRFIKIVLQACRMLPGERFKSAEELMSAILTFQFSTSMARREKKRHFWVTLIGSIGVIIGVSVILTLLCRLIWSLKHGP